MKRALFLIASATISLASCDDVATTESTKVSPEQAMVMLDRNKYVEESDPDVLRAKSLLTKLTSYYHEPADTIAEWTSKVHGVLNERGIQESTLHILEEMTKAGAIPNTKYSDAITMYAAMRTNEQ